LHLHVRGELIRTTPEHPFYVLGRGWVPAMDIAAGEQLLGRSDEIVTVEEAFDTGEYETVYNVEVADHHTYFVGAVNSGWSIWAHNATKDYYISEDPSKREKFTLFRKADGQVVIDFVTGLGFWAGSLGDVMDELKKTGASRPGLPLPEKVYSEDPIDMGGWDGVLDRHGSDLLGQGPPPNMKFDMHALNSQKYPAGHKIPAHAHHVVMKKGSAAQRDDIFKTQAILRKYKIDPFFAKEILAWAPNYSHTNVYAAEVYEKLSGLGSRAAVIQALKDIAIKFKHGDWHAYP